MDSNSAPLAGATAVTSKEREGAVIGTSNSSSSEDDDEDLFQNTNRPAPLEMATDRSPESENDQT